MDTRWEVQAGQLTRGGHFLLIAAFRDSVCPKVAVAEITWRKKQAGVVGTLANPAPPHPTNQARAASPMPGMMRNRSLTCLSTAVVMILTRGNA